MLDKPSKYKHRSRGQQMRRRFISVFIIAILFSGGCYSVYQYFFAEDQVESIASAQGIVPSALPATPPATGSATPVKSTSVQPLIPSDQMDAIEIKKSEAWKLILVNKSNALTKKSKPEKLSVVQGKIKMDSRVNQAMKEMIAAAKKEDISLIVCSGYRTYAYQETLFNKKKKFYLDKKLTDEQATIAAAKVVAKPGTSEHQTGLAADIVTKSYQALDEGFADTKAYQWLNDHAAEYGFILRYPKADTAITGVIYEPWHYRYVGVDIAKQIKNEKVCFETFVKNHEIRVVD